MLSFVNVFLIFSVLLGHVWCVEFVFDYLFFLKGCAGKILRSLCEIRSEMGTQRHTEMQTGVIASHRTLHYIILLSQVDLSQWQHSLKWRDNDQFRKLKLPRLGLPCYLRRCDEPREQLHNDHTELLDDSDKLYRLHFSHPILQGELKKIRISKPSSVYWTYNLFVASASSFGPLRQTERLHWWWVELAASLRDHFCFQTSRTSVLTMTRCMSGWWARRRTWSWSSRTSSCSFTAALDTSCCCHFTRWGMWRRDDLLDNPAV